MNAKIEEKGQAERKFIEDLAVNQLDARMNYFLERLIIAAIMRASGGNKIRGLRD